MSSDRVREQRARRSAKRQGFTLQKLRGDFYRDDPDQAWMLSRDGRGELYGDNGGVSLEEVERYLGCGAPKGAASMWNEEAE